MAKYRQSYAGVGRMLTSPEMQAEMERRAEAMKAYAESIAPVFEEGPHPGRYKRAFQVTSGIRRGARGGRRRRAYGRVTNTSPEGLLVEFGSENNPRHRVLGRSLQAARD